MESEPRDFRILLLVFSMIQSAAVGFAMIGLWIPGFWFEVYEPVLNGMALPGGTELLINLSAPFTPLKQWYGEISAWVGSIYFAGLVMLIWGESRFHQMFLKWLMVTTAGWVLILIYLGFLVIFLIHPLLVYPKTGMQPVLPKTQFFTFNEWVSIALMGWLIVLAAFVVIFIRRKRAGLKAAQGAR